MKFNTYACNDFKVVSLNGAFDAKTVEECRSDFEQLTDQADKGIVVDMSDVDFIDSSGIGALVFMYKRLSSANRAMHMIGLKDQPARLIKLLRINRTINTHTSIKDFLALPQIASA